MTLVASLGIYVFFISGRGWDFERQNDSDPSSFVTPYDYSSIMHYGDGFASKNDEKTLVPTESGVRRKMSFIVILYATPVSLI